MPIAAATPIAGAPRITIVLIARATSAAVAQRTYTSSAGSLRWSIMTTTSSSLAMVGSMQLIAPLRRQTSHEIVSLLEPAKLFRQRELCQALDLRPLVAAPAFLPFRFE